MRKRSLPAVLVPSVRRSRLKRLCCRTGQHERPCTLPAVLWTRVASFLAVWPELARFGCVGRGFRAALSSPAVLGGGRVLDIPGRLQGCKMDQQRLHALCVIRTLANLARQWPPDASAPDVRVVEWPGASLAGLRNARDGHKLRMLPRQTARDAIVQLRRDLPVALGACTGRLHTLRVASARDWRDLAVVRSVRELVVTQEAGPLLLNIVLSPFNGSSLWWTDRVDALRSVVHRWASCLRRVHIEVATTDRHSTDRVTVNGYSVTAAAEALSQLFYWLPRFDHWCAGPGVQTVSTQVLFYTSAIGGLLE